MFEIQGVLMQIDKEQLDLLIRLQPFFKEKMGKFQAGDMVYKKSTIFGEELDSKIWIEEKRVEIIIVREQSSIESFWHCTNEKGDERLLTDQDMFETTCYRIPAPLDLTCSERCLWGMINNKKELKEAAWDDKRGNVRFRTLGGTKEFYADNPTTAILKALCEQYKA